MLSIISSLLLAGLALAAPRSDAYINTAISRTVELGGATSTVTTQLNVKSLSDAPGEYQLALAQSAGEEGPFWEVSVAGKKVEGLVLEIVDGAPTVRIPKSSLSLKKDQASAISLVSTLARASVPLPAEIAQRDDQYLLWTTNTTYIPSWYPTTVERIKVRSAQANILSYTDIPTTYTGDNVVTKAGATVTLGPFSSLPPTLGSPSSSDAVKRSENPPFKVHYEHKEALVAVEKLKRSIEVSHWGGNVNVQDEMELVNIGPKLKGQFSRLAHQQSKFHAGSPAQILTDLTLRLPPGAYSPYYYDTIGNVSTSRFRPGRVAGTASGKVKKSRTVDGQLELKPRYPLLGGWKYAFVTGYDLPLGDVLKTVKGEKGDELVLGVPFVNAWKDLVYGDVEVVVILPEGAKDVKVYTPFPVDSIDHTITRTYLDSTGRHTVVIKKHGAVENHAQDIFVTYTYPTAALLQKPLTVASVVGGLFILAMGLRRIDFSIEKRAPIKVKI